MECGLRSRVNETVDRPSVPSVNRSRFSAERRASRRYRSTAAGIQQQRRSAANASSVTLNTVLFKEAQNKFSDADFVVELTRTLAIANRSCATKRPTEVIILPSQYRQSRDPNQRNYPQA